MTNRLNKTSICSIVFLDIVEYSEKSVSEQIEEKVLFNSLVGEALKDIAQSDRIILDTGDGAAISMMGEPEEALFAALTIRDSILSHNETNKPSLFVRIGINLGSVRVVKDINGQLNILGDGINVAQRIMSFAEPNQIMVSRSYFEVTSRLTKEFTSMFTYSGVKQDKHVREHEVYLINPTAQPENVQTPAASGKNSTSTDTASAEANSATSSTEDTGKQNLSASAQAAPIAGSARKYLLWALPVLAVLVALAFNGKKGDEQPATEAIKPGVSATEIPKVDVPTPALPANMAQNPEETKPETVPNDAALAQQKVAEKKAAERKAAKLEAAEKKMVEKKANEQKIAEQRTAEKKAPEQKVSEQKTVEHKAVEHKPVVTQQKAPPVDPAPCSQAQIAMHQCTN